jgi:hypothetical protein
LYYWWIKYDDDATWVGSEYCLNIVSSDGEFAIRYPIEQKSQNNLIVVIGRKFGGCFAYSGRIQRAACPKWEDNSAITPSIVRQIILWCMSDKNIVLLDYRGELLTAE